MYFTYITICFKMLSGPQTLPLRAKFSINIFSWVTNPNYKC